jgi:pyrimidine deaminase RibD-like protein
VISPNKHEAGTSGYESRSAGRRSERRWTAAGGPPPGTAAADREWLAAAIELSRRCRPVPAAYSVGAIVVAADGRRLADGWSRRAADTEHAEEAALAALGGVTPAGATVYTSLEPCSTRRSRPRSCTELILAAGVGRVVLALREPPLLADCQGVRLLRAAGVEVVEQAGLAAEVRSVNAHLFPERQVR